MRKLQNRGVTLICFTVGLFVGKHLGGQALGNQPPINADPNQCIP